MSKPSPGYRLTADLVAAHGGGPVVCLAASAIGQTYQTYATRPGAHLNQCIVADYAGEVPGVIQAAPVESTPCVVRVDIRGPITQRSEPLGPCEGFTAGHDTIAASLIAALEVGDVLSCWDTPGGAYSGGQQAIAAVLEAKALHGRRITGWVDELCASMGVWWAYSICDEIYIPIAGAIGSIGARAAHGSVAGALAQAGVAVTFACWPDEGKIAGVAELPLSDLGRERMQEGVDEAGEQFAAAMEASAFGKRHGLTVDYIRSLRANCLSGEKAVAAGLADGVSSFKEVQQYALALAGTGGTDMGLKAGDEDPEKKDAVAAEEPDEPKDDKEGEGDDAEPEGEEPSSACAKCSCANEPNAKFCDQCGSSMAAEPNDDAEPESSKRPGAMAPAAVAPKAMSASASLAAILGATGTSDLAIKTAAIQLRQIRDTAAGVTSQTSTDRIVGGLLSMPSRLEAAAQIQKDRKVEAAARNKAERWALCNRGIASGASEMTRGKVKRDIVGDDGKRKGTVLQPQFAEMKLGTLRGLVEGYEASATKKDPFVPDRDAAQALANQANGSVPAVFSDADKRRLEQHPSTLLLTRRGSALPPARIVESLISTEPQAARAWLTQNGAAS